MNIRQHIAVEKLAAGGPGSGRHKVHGEFVAENKMAMHKVAVKYGGKLDSWERGSGAGRGGKSPQGHFSFPNGPSAKSFVKETHSSGHLVSHSIEKP